MKIKQIFDVHYTRSGTQALMFFLVYGVIVSIAYAVLAFPLCWNAVTYQESYNCGYMTAAGVGKFIVAFLFFSITLAVVYTRKINVLAKIGLISLSTGAGFVLGIIGGLIITSFITTSPSEQDNTMHLKNNKER